MKPFFHVTDLADLLKRVPEFDPLKTEKCPLGEATGRVLAETVTAKTDLPGFARSVMDGFAVKAASTFGASEGTPAYLTVKGRIPMGEVPDLSIGPGEAAAVATGGMMPAGADAVVMVEQTEALDDTTIEVYKSVAPGGHMVAADEDFRCGETLLAKGKRLRPQDAGLLAAMGIPAVTVYQKPQVGIISTGDEVVPIEQFPGPGKVRDINTYTLSGMTQAAGGIPRTSGIVGDDGDALYAAVTGMLERNDILLVSGGSSMGTRDLTVEVFEQLPGAEILAHGISVSPGKPTILCRSENKMIWGLPGHVVSAMIVFTVVVRPFLHQIAGVRERESVPRIPARLSRNLPSVQGRVDFVRVRLTLEDTGYAAEPVPGKSALLNTMIQGDGLIEIDRDTEGLNAGTLVFVLPFQ